MAEDEGTDDSELEPALGRAIVARRGELGLKRNDLRDRTGLSYPYIAELENGTKRPSSRALAALAEALELRASELLERAEILRTTTDAVATAPPPPAAAQSPLPLSSRSARPRSGRWFGGTSAGSDQDDENSTLSFVSDAPSPQAAEPPLTESRLREIVRDVVRDVVREELERSGIEPDPTTKSRRRRR